MFIEALVKSPDLFARTHIIYNMDIPDKKTNLPLFELEEVLRGRELQLWFAFKDDENYDRFTDGTPMKAYDAVQKLQARMAGERQRAKSSRKLNYDELLISENLNANPKSPHVQDLALSVYTLLVFSTAFLESICFFLEVAPGTKQDGMDGGLVGDFRKLAHSEALTGDANEPLAVRRNRVGHLHGLQERRTKSTVNKMRLAAVERLTDQMQLSLPDVQNGAMEGFNDELAKRLGDRGSRSGGSSRSSSRTGSRSGSKLSIRDDLSKFRDDFSKFDPSASRNGSRLSTKGSNSRGGSRESTKDGTGLAPALPSLLRASASAPQLQALANEPANEDSDEEMEDEEQDDAILGGASKGEYPWQAYRRMWEDMHGRKPTGFTHPMKNF